jgi:hypothetical protein
MRIHPDCSLSRNAEPPILRSWSMNVTGTPRRRSSCFRLAQPKQHCSCAQRGLCSGRPPAVCQDPRLAPALPKGGAQTAPGDAAPLRRSRGRGLRLAARPLEAPSGARWRPKLRRCYDPGQPGTARPIGTARSLMGADRSPAIQKALQMRDFLFVAGVFV